jgi:dephospho-CoA kinase
MRLDFVHMYQMKFIFLSGFAGSGKDTVADQLVSMGYVKYAFAQPIKQSVANTLSIPVEWCSDQDKKATYKTTSGMTLREYIIDVAERERKKDPEVWAKKIAQQIKYSTAKQVVFSDWRNLHELFCIQKTFPGAEIVCVRIKRSGQNISSVPDLTEYSLLGFPFQYMIENITGDYEYLEKQIKSIA